ncbi:MULTISPECIES: hypothetical protein [Thermomonas]|jgi:hypothetical protein|uniref:DUF4124 domain-containing protein n=1 Tax=Thermomonas fusca TaxID=215690 RepID=A0A5R9PHJ0_9GAMM|nr:MULTISPECIES: hypothetical protein [Thermomonas]TLX22463.1 hypothetical protein E5S66_00035 [Thermomonas fusca]
MPHHRHIFRTAVAALALAGAGAAAAQTAAPTQKKIYCWDEGGRRVCGDALPASAVDRARTEINVRSGIPTKQVDRALTEAERSVAEVAAETARRQAEAEALQKRRDLAMVESYLTEADLRRAYGERTALLDETLKASRLGLSNLRLSLLSLLRQAGDLELAESPVPRKLIDSIRRQHGELLRQQQILLAQEADRAELERELADSVQRYRAMRQDSGAPAAAPAATAPTPAG